MKLTIVPLRIFHLIVALILVYAVSDGIHAVAKVADGEWSGWLTAFSAIGSAIAATLFLRAGEAGHEVLEDLKEESIDEIGNKHVNGST